MFHLIIYSCFLQISVSEFIHGRILLDGNEQKLVRLPMDSKLIIQLQNTLLADAPATILQQIQLSYLDTFPIDYQIEIPTNISPILPYSLSVRILKHDTLLYINDQHISIKIESENSIQIDIPVINVNHDNIQSLSWPELLGKEGIYAVEYIKENNGLTNVFTISENSPITMDYQSDRVRIYIDENGIVTQIPHNG